MNEQERKQLEGNLFPRAWHALDWDRFRWHTDHRGRIDTWKVHSSQALCIDVFGTLKNEPKGSLVLFSLARQWNIPVRGKWNIELEWSSAANPLKEVTLTQVDAFASNEESLILFEGKFTETARGFCSQAHRSGAHRKCEASDGVIEVIAEHCILTKYGIRYWEVIPKTFRIDPAKHHRTCPFMGCWYQWMRNVVLAHELGQLYGKRPVFVLVFVDSSELPMRRIISYQWREFRRLVRTVPVKEISYQQIVGRAKEIDQANPAWQELGIWVDRKIVEVVSRTSRR